MTKQHTDDRPTTRRHFLRTGVAVNTMAILASSGGATAQTDAEGRSTDDDDEDREITLTAALPADAPTYGDDDYTELFVQVGNRKGNVNPPGIDSCSFVASEDIEKVWGYNAEMFDRTNGDTGGETTTLYALAENYSLGPEKRYIINNSHPCGDYVEVELERLPMGAVSGPETATPGGEGGGAGATETNTPGFGVLAALGGIGAATAGALAARGRNGDE